VSELSIAAALSTIGRDSPRRAIDSILDQGHSVSELEVVNPESPQQFVEFGARLTRDKAHATSWLKRESVCRLSF
jgi:hypothetical protein